MIDLSTEYLGLKLDNPLVPSSSPLTGELDSAKKLEDAGASALVLPSLFEESIEYEQKQLERFVHSQALGNYEAQSYQPIPDDYGSELDNYLDRIQRYKSSLGIPIIASLNGISTNGWIDTGRELQQAGADALELNVYYIAADPDTAGEVVEKRYIQLLTDLRQHITIPVTMKLSSQFSSVANMVLKLQHAGAQGVSLFNRFYQPDIDLETLQLKPHLELSNSNESLLRIRWIALIRDYVNISIAATGGFHNTSDIIKALLVGADITHLCSVLLNNGPSHISVIKDELLKWLEEHEYDSVTQMKGSLSKACAINPEQLEHCNYMHVIKSYAQ
ncbi:MAG: dihydroorotate dehydrogenase-like protein [Gammaproteobacteria bacterium]|nr:dihydroorotate dehydrogenase-like protein [Gammaproteobacteria bacterium]MCW8987446.1 dihydroorotate dehydrogenase-like protein [Gammaproteobacteria bacterium]